MVELDVALQEIERERYVERLRSDLHFFLIECWSIICKEPFDDNWHIRLMCRYLEALYAGEINGKEFLDLIINIPPGCCKSLLVSIAFPAWIWAKDPTKRIMTVTYSDRLTKRFATRSRDLIGSEWYQRYFPEVQIRADKDSGGHFETTVGGYRLGTTPGSVATGEHPHFVIIDDPVNAKQAKQKQNENVNEWFDSTMSTRGVVVACRTVIIMQRLNQNDLVGHILDNKEDPTLANDWVQLCLPMRYEVGRFKDVGLGIDPRTKEGELLWPSVYPERRLKKPERRLGLWGVACQMQQRPMIKAGNFFPVDRIQFIDPHEVPELARYARSWDKAATEGGGCNTAGVLGGSNEDGSRVYFIDVAAEQLRISAVENLILSLAAIDKARYRELYEVIVEREGGSSGPQAIWETSRRLRGFRFHSVNPREYGNKEQRAQKLATAMHNYEVYCVRGPWTNAFIDELRQFPNGKLKDRADAAAQLYNRIVKRRWLLPDDEDDEDADDMPEYYLCANPDCTRPAIVDGEYCCEGCKNCHLTGRQPMTIGVFAHSPACHQCTHTAQANGWRGVSG